MSKNLLKKVVFVVVFCIMSATVYSIICLNPSVENGFGKKKGKGDSFSGSFGRTIDRKTFDGASMFLKSYSDALLLLNAYELSGVTDFDCLYASRLAESAIVYLRRSRETYREIVKISHMNNCWDEKHKPLMEFNYEKFVSDHNLNRSVMDRVATHYRTGKLYTVFKQAVEDQSEILFLLETIKEKLDKGEIPNVKFFFAILQKYAESSLFGNYASLVLNYL